MKNFIKDYILDNEFKLTLFTDRLNIVNYTSLLEIKDNIIKVKDNDNVIKITGNNLTLNKLLDKEILVSGTIKNIEVDYE